MSCINLKNQGTQKVKVKGTQYPDQMKWNKFSVCYKCLKLWSMCIPLNWNLSLFNTNKDSQKEIPGFTFLNPQFTIPSKVTLSPTLSWFIVLLYLEKRIFPEYKSLGPSRLRVGMHDVMLSSKSLFRSKATSLNMVTNCEKLNIKLM